MNTVQEYIDVNFPDPKTGHKRPAVWRDRAGVMHRAVGSYVHRDVPRLLWTLCGQKDVPANAAWLQNSEDRVTCKKCLKVMA